MSIQRLYSGSLAAIAMMLIPVVGQADGELGNTSATSSRVEFTKLASVKVSNLDDIIFPAAANLSEDAFLVEKFCVFSSTGLFNLVLDSANGTNSFQMSNGSELLEYNIVAGSLITDPQVPEGQTISPVYGDSESLNCDNEDNMDMGILVQSDDFNLASPGNYVDTLTVTVTPL